MEVRATVHARLARLKSLLRGKHSTDSATEAHLRLAERDLIEFLEKPEVRRSRPLRPPAPPGGTNAPASTALASVIVALGSASDASPSHDVTA